MFPAASGWLGPRRVAALAATSLLVGMVCPGLHSIYGDLTVEACDEKDPEDRLGFRVVSTEPRFRLVRLAIEGGGLVGSIKTVARMPPAPQAPSSELACAVEPGEFAGSTALVVGGSRGLGEVTAKLLAAGGAQVVITYRVGSAEAEAVARDIRAAGGMCETLAYDAGRPAEAQLVGLCGAPTHAYYFATPTIFRAQSALFARARLDAFLDVYVDGFLRLAEALRARRNDVSLLYPSSVYVAERPRGMLEYAMAKAAGETLCSEMNLAWAPLRVTVDRLPRLPTDQTASVIEPTCLLRSLPAAGRAGGAVLATGAKKGTRSSHARAEPSRAIGRTGPPRSACPLRLPQQDRRQCSLIRRNSCLFFCQRPSWFLFARQRLSPSGNHLAYPVVPGLLWVVAAGQRPDHRSLDHHQLRSGIDPAAAEPGGRLACPVEGGSIARDRVQRVVSRIFQVY